MAAMRSRYDVVVIGGGHAGTEAAWAAAHALGSGGTVALVTMDPSKIGTMSCNPAIGGLAKGQMVREIDALGGIMGRATDATGIQFRMLNTSKGAAVRGPRAQCDKDRYACAVQRLIASEPAIDVLAGTIDDLLVEDGVCVGVLLPAGAGLVEPRPERDDELRPFDRPPETPFGRTPRTPSTEPVAIRAGAVVLTTGTFMRALMHTGTSIAPGGRIGEGSAVGISACLARLGFELGRLKTGTPPRLDRATLELDRLPAQPGDDPPIPFSDLVAVDHAGRSNVFPSLPQILCWETATTPETHEIIRANLHRAPMYAGQVDAECGPRYCPSIEDKVVRFADRGAHHVFLEPETLHGRDIYCNGISTSLPSDVQDAIVHAMAGCGKATILRYGYAVEYDMVRPHQIDATGATKSIRGLFLAGQINGTSGYEEAGAQGLVAGLNAALLVRDRGEVRFGREQAYIGVLMDDLVTRTPREPYRMFTSRAEHRLLLRHDNADERLTPLAIELGLACATRRASFEARMRELAAIRTDLERTRVDGRSLAELAKRPDVSTREIVSLLPERRSLALVDRVLNDLRYAGYVARQQAEIRRLRDAERRGIPTDLDPSSIHGLRTEAIEALARFRPATMGQASRLEGITPGDMSLLDLAVRRHR
jgi:tRNA uridine 5-carboxymethylaminomethyl modification enzyme